MVENALQNPETIALIERALKQGNSVEIKKERDNIVVVEIHRHVVSKDPISR